jgi:hypothetical protein
LRGIFHSLLSGWVDDGCFLPGVLRPSDITDTMQDICQVLQAAGSLFAVRLPQVGYLCLPIAHVHRGIDHDEAQFAFLHH